MSSIDQRIEQWEQMAREVPDDMAFFSLGNAYKDAERYEDSETAFAKALEMNPGMSRAYQLRGQMLIKLGRNDEAARVLVEGFKTAANRGDVMPEKAIGSLLEKIGQPIPQVTSAEEKKKQIEASGEVVLDQRTGEPQSRLDGPPLRSALGKYLYDHVGQDTWREWIGQGTKVINELRLDFSNPEHQDIYDHHMLEWFGVTKEQVQAYADQVESNED